MNVLIVGYGNMGREVEHVLKQRGHTVSARIDPVDPEADRRQIDEETATASDVAIEFSLPDAVVANADRYAQYGLNAVVGTTGWSKQLDSVKAILSEKPIGLVHGSNFSVGAQVFLRIVAFATRLVDALPEYDILAYEIHHKRKKDSPSGTALTLADTVLENSTRKGRIVTERLDRQREDDELHLASVRGGQIPGIHTVLVDSLADTVELTHRARTRGGFALGAVMAGEWIRQKKGLYTVSDFIEAIVSTASGAEPG